MTAHPLNVFICYAREDRKQREELSRHLRSLRDQNVIELWHDGEITPGKEWDLEIKDALRAAEIILLLISVNFLNSDYIRRTELPLAIERHKANTARVIPVLLQHTDYEKQAFEGLQMLPLDEGELKPIDMWDNAAEAYLNVVKGIRRAIKDLSPSEGSRGGVAASLLGGNEAIGREEALYFLLEDAIIGRENEIARIRQMLSNPRIRLIMLTGTPGVGKTRLAEEIARRMISAFVGGVKVVWLGNLRTTEDTPTGEDQIVEQIARQLRVSENYQPDGGKEDQPKTGEKQQSERRAARQLETLVQYFRAIRPLLVLDNCEHVLGPCVKVMEHLLSECKDLKILATSCHRPEIRTERLRGAQIETEYLRVLPLPTPEHKGLPEFRDLEESELVGLKTTASVELLVRLVQKRYLEVGRSHTFELTNKNARAVAEICYLLDGIPLAIELISAALLHGTQRIADMLNEPERRSGLLEGGEKTMTEAISVSYELLGPIEQQLFRRLSVFVSGWTLDAAEAVCSDESVKREDILSLLTKLANQSLVQYDGPDGDTRYQLLFTIREYAQDQLDQKERAAVEQRHAEFYLGYVRAHEEKLKGAEQTEALMRLDMEHDNVQAALAWSLKDMGDPQIGLQLAAAMALFWSTRGYVREGARWLTEVIEANPNAPAGFKAKALLGAGLLAFTRRDYAQAIISYKQSRDLYREVGDQQGLAWAIHDLGMIARAQGNLDDARALYRESLALFEIDNTRGVASTLKDLGTIERDKKEPDYPEAMRLYTKSLGLFQNLGDKRGIVWTTRSLAIVAGKQGNKAEAESYLKQTIPLFEEIGDKQGLAWVLHELGTLMREQRDFAQAKSYYQRALPLYEAIGDIRGLAWGLNNAGSAIREMVTSMQADMRNYDEARSYYQRAMRLFEQIDNKRGKAWTKRSLGIVAFREKKYREAKNLFEQSLELFLGVSDGKRGAALTYKDLAGVAEEGDQTLAVSFYQKSLPLLHELENIDEMATAFSRLAALFHEQNERSRAAQLLGTAEVLFERRNKTLPSSAHGLDDAAVTALRNQFAADWLQGRTSELDEAVAYAVKDTSVD